MIKHVLHADLDKQKWDDCIQKSPNGLIYAYSWYLDVVAPGWQALVSGDYDAVFPLTHRKKIFAYLYQPYFTQQLGLFGKSVSAISLSDFINSIPSSFRLIDIQLNESNILPEKKWPFKQRKNYVLDLDKPYPKLLKNFTEHTKRNLKKALKNELRIQSIESDKAVDFYVKHKGQATAVLTKADYTRLKVLLNKAAAHAMLRCYAVLDKEEEVITTAVVLSENNRLYIINNTASKTGRELRGMYFLVNSLIETHAQQPILLDFEGSDIPGIAQFNKGFGAVKRPYSRLHINRLPWYIKWLKT